MGPTTQKRKFLMVAYVIQKSFWNTISFFGNFDGTHIPKKVNFDGLHKHSKNDFGTQISFFGNFGLCHHQVT